MVWSVCIGLIIPRYSPLYKCNFGLGDLNSDSGVWKGCWMIQKVSARFLCRRRFLSWSFPLRSFLSFFFTLRRFKLWITFAVHSSEAVCENTEVINPIKFTCQILLRLKCRLSANDSKARCTRATLWYFSHTLTTPIEQLSAPCFTWALIYPHTKTDIYKQKSSMLSAVKLCNCFLCWNSHWHAFFSVRNL